MSASRCAAFAGCVSDMIVQLYPFTFGNAVLVGNMHVQDIPSSLFQPIAIRIYDHNTVTGPDNKARCRGDYPLGSRATASLVSGWRKIQGGKWTVMLPGAVWSSSEGPW